MFTITSYIRYSLNLKINNNLSVIHHLHSKPCIKQALPISSSKVLLRNKGPYKWPSYMRLTSVCTVHDRRPIISGLLIQVSVCLSHRGPSAAWAYPRKPDPVIPGVAIVRFGRVTARHLKTSPNCLLPSHGYPFYPGMARLGMTITLALPLIQNSVPALCKSVLL